MVREIYDWFTENKWGVTKIASMLNLRGTKGKTGVNWDRKPVTSILRNPVMCGRVLCNGQAIEGQHEGIVSVEQFEAAQAIREGRATIPNRSQQSNYLLSGLLRCGGCGYRLGGHMVVNKKTGTRYLSYLHPSVPKTTEHTCRSLAKRVHIEAL